MTATANTPVETKALSLEAEFGTDSAAELDGVWVTYKGTAKFLIARAQNERFVDEYRRQLTARGLTADQAGSADPVIKANVEDAYRTAVALTVLLGWEGFQFSKGEGSDPAARRAALDFSDLRVWVFTKAYEREHFALKAVDAEKN